MLSGPVSVHHGKGFTFDCESVQTNLQVCDCVFDGVEKIKVVDKIRRSLWFKVKSEKEKIC